MKQLFTVLALFSFGLNGYCQQTFHFWNYNIFDGLPQNFIYDFEEDEQGYLWLATGGGVSRFNGTKFENFSIKSGLTDNFCRDIEIYNGNLFAAGYQGGLSKKGTNKFVPIEFFKEKIIVDLVSGEKLFATISTGKVFGISENGIEEIEDLKGVKQIQFYGESLLCLKNGNIMLYSNGQLSKWSNGTSNVLGLACNDSSVVFFDTLFYSTNFNLGSLNNYISKNNIELEKCQLFNQELFVIHSDGVLCYNLLTGQLEAFTVSSGLEKHVNSIFIDNEGVKWFGSSGNGLYGLPSDYFYEYLLREEAKVNAILKVDEGILAGTTKGLYLISIDNQNALFTDSVFAVTNQLKINHLLKDNDLIYLATENGLFNFNLYSGELKEVLKGELGGEITFLFMDDENQIWVSTLLNGVFKIEDDKVLENYNTSNGLAHNNITSIYQDSKGLFWFGALGTAVCKLNENDFEYYSLDEGLFNLDIAAISEDSKNDLWMATKGGGLYHYTDNNFESYSLSSGLPSSFAYSIMPVKEGIYTNTRSSISFLDYETRRYHNYNERYVGVTTFSENCALKIDSNLIYGTDRGIMFLTHKVKAITPDIYTNVVRFMVSGEEVEIKDSLMLPYDKYTLQFDFEGISTKNANSLEFQFLLEGYDEDWLTPNKISSARYSGIANGDYCFKVKVAGQDDLHTYSLPFTISTPFWKSKQFIIFVGLLLITIVFAFIRIRTITLKRQKLALEKVVRKRTTQLRHKNRRLQQISYAISHDLKNPVVNIKGLSDILKSLPSGAEEKGEIIKMIDESSVQLEKTIFQFIEVLKIKSNEETPVQEIEFDTLFKEIKTSISQIIIDNNVTFETDFIWKKVEYNKSNLRSILYNLVSNSIKYKSETRDPIIKITTKDFDNEFIVLEVIDNGLGIDLAKDKDKLFGIFTRIHDHVEGSGVGLHMIQEVVHMNGGKIEVDSQPGIGSAFKIYIRK